MSDCLTIKCMILLTAISITAYSGIILNRVNKIGVYSFKQEVEMVRIQEQIAENLKKQEANMVTLQEEIQMLKQMIAENTQVDTNSITDETVIELLEREQIDSE